MADLPGIRITEHSTQAVITLDHLYLRKGEGAIPEKLRATYASLFAW